ncbi:hypothetical protein [Soonwooa sp.]|uniref:hypothetical protein n=1 Tax=Soonwooa sp. TaxID=1938592 RepID=UPI00391815AE
MKDLELISLALTAEYMGIDSENHLFRQLPKAIKCKIERSVYNRRKRRLSNKINDLRMKIAESFNEFEKFFIIDSMPVEVCKLSRSAFRKSVKMPNIVIQTEVVVPHNKCLFMATNFMRCVL